MSTAEILDTVEQHKKLIRQVTESVVNRGELAAVRTLFSAEYVLHKTGLSVPRGPEAFKMAIRQWRDGFPDYHVEIKALIGDGDLIACRFVASGTHRGALLGVPPTEKSFQVEGTDVHRVADGLVAESWLADDIPRLLTELGVMAPTNAGSSRWT
jgi:predicted ester cyclase